MQYLYIDSMDEKDYQKYIDKISDLDTGKHLFVVIHSGGGETFLMELLRDQIRKFSTYNLYVGDAQSNGLVLVDELAIRASSISFSDAGGYIVHLGRRQIFIGNGGTPLKGWEKHKMDMQQKLEVRKFGFFTEEEQKMYEDGEDVYIVPERLREYYENLRKEEK